MDKADAHAEGWYHDPYHRHEARWFSDGTPTDLVRDGREVAHEPPPEEVMPTPLTPWESGEESTGDLRRADAAQDGSTVDARTVASKVARVMFNRGDTEYW